jgi:hypothetical protein
MCEHKVINKNIDNNVPIPTVTNNNTFLLPSIVDKRYGYDPDYPINVFYLPATKPINQNVLNALANGENL